MYSIILVCFLAGTATALNCYQGTQNASIPATGSATACPQPSLSCLKSYENQTNTVTRSCQTANCTLNGALAPTGFCQNTTQYPYQVFCCCFGDGCNGSSAYSSLVLRFGWFILPLLAFVSYSGASTK